MSIILYGNINKVGLISQGIGSCKYYFLTSLESITLIKLLITPWDENAIWFLAINQFPNFMNVSNLMK